MRLSRFNHSHVVLFGHHDFDSNGTLGMGIVILREVDANDSVDLVLVLLIHLHKLLDVPVVREWELGVGQDWRIELKNVHVDWLLRGYLGLLCRFLGGAGC